MVNVSMSVNPFYSITKDQALIKSIFRILVDRIKNVYGVSDKTVVTTDIGVMGMYYVTDEETHEKIIKEIGAVFNPGLFIFTEERTDN